jgi:membrane associated rhomboid family serine protease
MNNTNINTEASVSTRLKVWFTSIPFMTRCLLVLMTTLFIAGYIIKISHYHFCTLPRVIIDHPLQFYRLLTSTFLHGGVLHILMNSMAFLALGPWWERTVGSLLFFYQICLLFPLGAGLIHILLALIASYNPIYPYLVWTNSCGVGFSGVLFTLMILQVQQSRESNTSLYGLISVPTKIYPWVLLILLQVILPNVSLLGHLSGMLIGYAYVFGLLKWDPVPILLSKVESAGFMRYVTQFNGYIVGTNYGMHNNGLPVSDNANEASGPGVFERVRNSLRNMTSGNNDSGYRVFDGQGQVLGSANNNNNLDNNNNNMHSDTAIEMTDDVARKDTTIDIQNAKV